MLVLGRISNANSQRLLCHRYRGSPVQLITPIKRATTPALRKGVGAGAGASLPVSSASSAAALCLVAWLQPGRLWWSGGEAPGYASPGRFALQLTILTRSAWIWCVLSSLKLISLMIKVQTSSQKRYVSRWPWSTSQYRTAPLCRAGATDLECQAGLDLLREDVGDGAVEVGEDLHGQLGLDAALRDEVVQRVCERAAQAAACVSHQHSRAGSACWGAAHTCFGGRAHSTWCCRWPWRWYAMGGWSGHGDVWGRRGEGWGRERRLLTKPAVLAASARRGLFRLHHRQQLRSPSHHDQSSIFPIHLRLAHHHSHPPTMSLTYGTGGATAALGVVALCRCCAQGRRRRHS